MSNKKASLKVLKELPSPESLQPYQAAYQKYLQAAKKFQSLKDYPNAKKNFDQYLRAKYNFIRLYSTSEDFGAFTTAETTSRTFFNSHPEFSSQELFNQSSSVINSQNISKFSHQKDTQKSSLSYAKEFSSTILHRQLIHEKILFYKSIGMQKEVDEMSKQFQVQGESSMFSISNDDCDEWIKKFNATREKQIMQSNQVSAEQIRKQFHEELKLRDERISKLEKIMEKGQSVQSVQSSRTDLKNYDEEIEKLKENSFKNNAKLEFIFHEISTTLPNQWQPGQIAFEKEIKKINKNLVSKIEVHDFKDIKQEINQIKLQISLDRQKKTQFNIPKYFSQKVEQMIQVQIKTVTNKFESFKQEITTLIKNLALKIEGHDFNGAQIEIIKFQLKEDSSKKYAEFLEHIDVLEKRLMVNDAKINVLGKKLGTKIVVTFDQMMRNPNMQYDKRNHMRFKPQKEQLRFRVGSVVMASKSSVDLAHQAYGNSTQTHFSPVKDTVKADKKIKKKDFIKLKEMNDMHFPQKMFQLQNLGRKHVEAEGSPNRRLNVAILKKLHDFKPEISL